jgi:hypothetical protein
MTRRSRLTQEQRGYGVTYRRGRAVVKPLVAAGLARCVYCGEVIVGAFHLDHSDDRRSVRGPAHPRCNVVEAGLKSARLRHGEGTVTSQRW